MEERWSDRNKDEGMGIKVGLEQVGKRQKRGRMKGERKQAEKKGREGGKEISETE